MEHNILPFFLYSLQALFTFDPGLSQHEHLIGDTARKPTSRAFSTEQREHLDSNLALIFLARTNRDSDPSDQAFRKVWLYCASGLNSNWSQRSRHTPASTISPLSRVAFSAITHLECQRWQLESTTDAQCRERSAGECESAEDVPESSRIQCISAVEYMNERHFPSEICFQRSV